MRRTRESLSSYTAKLIDFGISVEVGAGHAAATIERLKGLWGVPGTRGYCVDSGSYRNYIHRGSKEEEQVAFLCYMDRYSLSQLVERCCTALKETCAADAESAEAVLEKLGSKSGFSSRVAAFGSGAAVLRGATAMDLEHLAANLIDESLSMGAILQCLVSTIQDQSAVLAAIRGDLYSILAGQRICVDIRLLQDVSRASAAPPPTGGPVAAGAAGVLGNGSCSGAPEQAVSAEPPAAVPVDTLSPARQPAP